jgi:hypothetical protein
MVMPVENIQKPLEGEYAPYTIAYISLVPDDGRVLDHMADNQKLMKGLIMPLPDDKLTTPVADGEWTIKEILGHVIDTERILTYRALRFARSDATELPGFEQADYVPYSRANERAIDDLFAEYSAVRAATLALFNSFDEAAFMRAGKSNGHKHTVRALAYIVAGHELHHVNSIRENYLQQEV